jgi:hypothetical protein
VSRNLVLLISQHARLVRLNEEASATESADGSLALFAHRLSRAITVEPVPVKLPNGAPAEHAHDIVDLIHQVTPQVEF